MAALLRQDAARASRKVGNDLIDLRNTRALHRRSAVSSQLFINILAILPSCGVIARYVYAPSQSDRSVSP